MKRILSKCIAAVEEVLSIADYSKRAFFRCGIELTSIIKMNGMLVTKIHKFPLPLNKVK